MQAIPNTTVTILRPDGPVDTWTGQPTGGTTVVASGVPAFLIERPATRPRTGAEGRAVEGPNTTTPRLLRVFSIRLPFGTDVNRDDQIRDESTQRLFAVNSVRSHRLVNENADVICELNAVDTQDP